MSSASGRTTDPIRRAVVRFHDRGVRHRDVEIAGPISYRSTLLRRAMTLDFFVKLSEQMPQSSEDRGKGLNPASYWITKGWLRASHRALRFKKHQLAGIAAESGEERVAAQYALADLPLTTFLQRARRSLRDRRGHAPDRRYPRPRGLRADRASDRRRLSRLAACPTRRRRGRWRRSRPASRRKWRRPSARSAGCRI